MVQRPIFTIPDDSGRQGRGRARGARSWPAYHPHGSRSKRNHSNEGRGAPPPAAFYKGESRWRVLPPGMPPTSRGTHWDGVCSPPPKSVTSLMYFCERNRKKLCAEGGGAVSTRPRVRHEIRISCNGSPPGNGYRMAFCTQFFSILDTPFRLGNISPGYWGASPSELHKVFTAAAQLMPLRWSTWRAPPALHASVRRYTALQASPRERYV